MTRAARAQVRTQEVARPFDVPSPTRGWNAELPLTNMKRGDALQMDNWIPRAGYSEIRRGFLHHVVDMDVVPQSFLPYRAGNAEELFAVSDGEVFDVTASGALGAAVYTGLTGDRVASLNFANDAGVFMLCFNGQDTPFKYNGAAWSTNVITGSVGAITLDPKDIENAIVHKRRVFLQEKESLRVWYLGVNAISGATGLLDLGPVFSEGGALVGMGVWSAYATDVGPQAVAVFVTDQGQVAIFSGNNPADADDWFHVGTYTIGKPLGPRAMFNTASDFIIITHDGAIPLTIAMNAKRDQQSDKAITSRIKNAFAKAAASYGGKFGWEAITYPTGQLAIINVPITELGRAKQFVQNTQTGAWCQFLGINAVCWAYVNNQIFFAGTDGSGEKGVFRFDVGGSDNGTSIQCDVIPAFDDFGNGRIKNFQMLQPILNASKSLQPFVDMLVDYRLAQPSNVPDSEFVDDAGVWGESEWGTGLWTAGNPLRMDWSSTTGVGKVGAPRLRVISAPDAINGVYPVVRCELIGFNGTYTSGAAFG